MGKEKNHADLGQFGNLEGEKPHPEPSCRAARPDPQLGNENQRKKHDTEQDSGIGGLSQVGIRDLRQQRHGDEPEDHEDDLLFKKIPAVMMALLACRRHDGTGAVNHDRSDAHQDQHRQQEDKIRPLVACGKIAQRQLRQRKSLQQPDHTRALTSCWKKFPLAL